MDSGMRKNSKKVTTGCRQPCDILHHWSRKGYLSSYRIWQMAEKIKRLRSQSKNIVSHSKDWDGWTTLKATEYIFMNLTEKLLFCLLVEINQLSS